MAKYTQKTVIYEFEYRCNEPLIKVAENKINHSNKSFIFIDNMCRILYLRPHH